MKRYLFFHDTLSRMNSVTVADLGNRFADVSAAIRHGEKLLVKMRGVPFATLAILRKRKWNGPTARSGGRAFFRNRPQRILLFSTTTEVKHDCELRGHWHPPEILCAGGLFELCRVHPTKHGGTLRIVRSKSSLSG